MAFVSGHAPSLHVRATPGVSVVSVCKKLRQRRRARARSRPGRLVRKLARESIAMLGGNAPMTGLGFFLRMVGKRLSDVGDAFGKGSEVYQAVQQLQNAYAQSVILPKGLLIHKA